LFDEAFSSTSADEAIVISKEILYAFSEIGAKGIWTTHLHGLCCIADEEPNGKSRISNLTAELCEESHERLYRIVKGAKYGSSYAGDIAQKYHLTKTEIIENRNILN
jgi:DNA mismatch repair ATPase MutS